ncbi:unnamed protein product [Clonostachys chloroleuca]|uniref:Uncharacterized protein n=1 Tax=Clonostachys chloroleuca TaxID=1926264 RepID=A0AA35Q147_9HYPO|nr:unnamed protein product [Clonostachys chloroleuca]
MFAKYPIILLTCVASVLAAPATGAGQVASDQTPAGVNNILDERNAANGCRDNGDHCKFNFECCSRHCGYTAGFKCN